MSWLFVGGLCIIWAAFLLPIGSRRASPASTVEAFERKMDVLADTNRSPAGRYVLVPRKGERFMGSRDRKRMRVRGRRRRVFSVLVEATTLTLLIGLFPPLRAMLVGTVVLALVLLMYMALLVHLQAQDVRVARIRARQTASRARFEDEMARLQRVPVEALRHAAATNGHSNRYSNGNGHSNGNGNGHAWQAGPAEDDPIDGDGIQIVEDDVHVIVRRHSEHDAGSTRSLAR